MAKRETKTKTDDRRQLRVQFGGVSIGEATARVGIRLERELLNLDAADELFAGRRLTGAVMVVPDGESPDQQRLFDGDDKHEIESTFDVKGFRVAPKEIGCGLTFALAEIDVAQLGHFAKRSGVLLIDNVEALPDEDEDAEADEEDLITAAANGERLPLEDWRSEPISRCGITGKPAESLLAAHIDTLGKLQDLMQKHGSFWHREVKGIGEGKAEKIGEQFNAYLIRAGAE